MLYRLELYKTLGMRVGVLVRWSYLEGDCPGAMHVLGAVLGRFINLLRISSALHAP